MHGYACAPSAWAVNAEGQELEYIMVWFTALVLWAQPMQDVLQLSPDHWAHADLGNQVFGIIAETLVYAYCDRPLKPRG